MPHLYSKIPETQATNKAPLEISSDENAFVHLESPTPTSVFPMKREQFIPILLLILFAMTFSSWFFNSSNPSWLRDSQECRACTFQECKRFL
jgi:hypothetical protein